MILWHRSIRGQIYAWLAAILLAVTLLIVHSLIQNGFSIFVHQYYSLSLCGTHFNKFHPPTTFKLSPNWPKLATFSSGLWFSNFSPNWPELATFASGLWQKEFGLFYTQMFVLLFIAETFYNYGGLLFHHLLYRIQCILRDSLNRFFARE